ncbi:hypothetical protein NY607_12430 [Lysinibacillus sp. A4]|uniref:hypothetical protein n=1 Tax=Lysinibacillus sp. A4 TaxID=2976269 RepID=UPI002175F82C|nr:hypothetical protein [Lysinibacillus sp. A4]MCS5501933.1 hypothetical protein [Lysinibacillus sp. A4]
MIYVFEGENNLASVVFDGKYLSQENKDKAIKLESLPVDESTTSQAAILKADSKTGRVWYEYVDRVPTVEEVNVQLQKKVNELEQAILELTSIIAGGTA